MAVISALRVRSSELRSPRIEQRTLFWLFIVTMHFKLRWLRKTASASEAEKFQLTIETTILAMESAFLKVLYLPSTLKGQRIWEATWHNIKSGRHKESKGLACLRSMVRWDRGGGTVEKRNEVEVCVSAQPLDLWNYVSWGKPSKFSYYANRWNRDDGSDPWRTDGKHICKGHDLHSKFNKWW